MLEDYAEAGTLAEVGDVLMRRAERLGFRFAALVSPAAGLALHNLPAAWAARCAEAGEPVDPMFDVAIGRTSPFFWNDADALASLDARGRALLREAAAHGIADGFTVPIIVAGAPPAAGSVVPRLAPPEPAAYRLAHSEIVLAHERARRLTGAASAPIGLTDRERECLTLAARGKTDWEIGRILGLSQRQVHYVIERAKARADVPTRVQAIMLAVASGELMLAEALGDAVGRGSGEP